MVAGFDKVMSKELEAMHYKKFLFKYFFVQQIIDEVEIFALLTIMSLFFYLRFSCVIIKYNILVLLSEYPLYLHNF